MNTRIRAIVFSAIFLSLMPFLASAERIRVEFSGEVTGGACFYQYRGEMDGAGQITFSRYDPYGIVAGTMFDGYFEYDSDDPVQFARSYSLTYHGVNADLTYWLSSAYYTGQYDQLMGGRYISLEDGAPVGWVQSSRYGLVSVTQTSLSDGYDGFGMGGWDIRGRVDYFTPVPEPCTILLLGSGLAGLAGYGRRRKE